MKGLHVAPKLTLPVELAGEAVAILAKRGAGKTNTATVLVEELHAADVQVVILDPVGAWWGIRSSFDGQKPGLPFAILGGEHGDVQLEHTAGALIADVVVDSGQSLLLDLSDFSSKAQMARFVVDFCERLFRRKGRAKSLLHLVLEEADTFAPQKGGADDARMRGAVEQIVRRGRSRGLGLTMVTQRSAVLNKDVLSQADVLIAMRTTSPHDTAAVRLWVSAREEDEHGVIASLPSLQNGEAWIWNPERDILERVKVRRRKTFDSGETPKPGQVRAEPKRAADIDLDALGEQMKATAERARENDPKQLRARLAAAEELARHQAAEIDSWAASATKVERVEVPYFVPMLNPEDIMLLEGVRDRIAEQLEGARQAADALAEHVQDLIAKVESQKEPNASRRAEPVTPPPRPAPQAARPTPTVRPHLGDRFDPVDDLPLAASKMLTVLAQFPEGRTRKQLAVLSGYKQAGSTFRGGIADLRKRGYASPSGQEPIVATPAGLAAAPTEALPTGRALYDYWMGTLELGARKVLELLYDAYPEGIPRDELAERAGYDPTGSTFRGAMAALRNVDLATPAGVEPIRASDELME